MDKLVIGRRLFHDPGLSGDSTISCATCHSLDMGGAERRKVSKGIGGALGPINSPTVLNARFNFVQFWDGRAKDLKDQAAGPVENPIEMGANFGQVVEHIKNDPWYQERFAKVFPKRGVSKDTITEAIAEYEKGLVTPSPFDRYLSGDTTAISQQAKEGYAKFKEVGCTTCHNGINVGGDSFQKMGLIHNYFEARGGEITEADLGRYNVTKKDEDKHKFKTPTLRNIEHTAPYFHDGSVEDLTSAVKTMAWVQLNQKLDDKTANDIVAFLKSLSGELPDFARLPAEQSFEAAPESAAKASK